MTRHFIIFLTTLAVANAAPATSEEAVPESAVAEAVETEAAAPSGGFTFRRVKVPEPGAPIRITVQIDPTERKNPAHPNRDVTPQKQPLAPSEPNKTALAFDWYWAGISPAMADASPARLSAAVAHLAAAPSGQAVPVPGLRHMQNIARIYGADILAATIGTNVSPALVLAIISIESAGRAKALSSAGAQGLMQLMPATAARFGVTDANVAAQNIKGGVAYLDWLMQKFDRDPVLVLAGYNAGENAVIKNAGVPPYAETRAYVPKVLAAWAIARRLCQTPPELITDGCVFAVQRVATNG